MQVFWRYELRNGVLWWVGPIFVLMIMVRYLFAGVLW